MGDDSMWRGASVFYTIVFAGLAVLLVVAVIVQKSRRK
jgi:hypothetical protein